MNRFLIILFCVLLFGLAQAESTLKTRNVVLITFDGLRWQELFTGADASLIENEDFVGDPKALRAKFWKAKPAARRETLMPFFWTVLAKEGQIHGNRAHGNMVDVTNRHRFSFPGYNELLAGFADDRIDSNAKIENVNVTVLEHLNGLPEFSGAVAAFASWEVFPYIINERRSGIPVNAGFRVASAENLSPREEFLNELQPQVPSPWATVRLDAFTHNYAMEYLKKNRPRVIYIAYGDTDDFAHDGAYDQYLHAARRTDRFVGDLWSWLQSQPQYRDSTTMIITTDHGRGSKPVETWTDHGSEVDGAEHIWLAVIGPDTRPLGEVKLPGNLYQDQVARTLAAFLGVDYSGAGKAGDVIHKVMQ